MWVQTAREQFINFDNVIGIDCATADGSIFLYTQLDSEPFKAYGEYAKAIKYWLSCNAMIPTGE